MVEARSSWSEWITQLETGASLGARLQSLEAIEDRLPGGDPELSRQLLLLSRRSPGTLGRAIEKVLLRWRRREFHSETLSSSPTLESYRAGSRRALSMRALEDPSAPQRRGFLLEIDRQEIFEAAPVLAQRLRREAEPATAAVMAEVLGRLGGDNHVSILQRLIRHPEAIVRCGAARGLGFQTGRLRNECLFRALADEDKRVRVAAREGLEELPPASLIGLLEGLPEGRRSRVRARVIRILRPHRDDPEVSLILRSFLWSPDLRVACEALLVLADREDPRIQSRVAELRRSDDPRVKQVFRLLPRAAARSTRPGPPGPEAPQEPARGLFGRVAGAST